MLVFLSLLVRCNESEIFLEGIHVEIQSRDIIRDANTPIYQTNVTVSYTWRMSLEQMSYGDFF